MDHISANLAFGRRKKIFGVQKAPGGQEAYKKNRKKVATFFFLFFLETFKFLWGAAKNQQGGTKW